MRDVETMTRALLDAVATRRALQRTPLDDRDERVLAIVSITITALIVTGIVRWVIGLV